MQINLKTNAHNKKLKMFSLIIFLLLFFAFILSSVFFVISKNNIFPIINFLIFLLSLFIGKGKYRILSVVFFSPLFKCFNLYNSSFSTSFYTIGLIIYEFLVIISLFSRRKVTPIQSSIKKNYYVLIFSIYTVFLSLIFSESLQTVFKGVSFVIYFLLPFLCLLDPIGKKGRSLIFAFYFGTLLANIYAFSFLYIFKNLGVSFLEIFMPTYIKSYTEYSGTFFRFGGLRGDSNGNSLYILLSSSLLLTFINKKNIKKSFFIIFLIILLQPFALLGGSKTYYIGLIILIFGFFAINYYRNKYFTFIILAIAFCSFFVFIFGYNFFFPFLRRILMTDTRRGFLSGITTQRYDILINYLRNILNNPLYFLLGHGSRSPLLYNSDFHNTLLQLIWSQGIIGTILYIISVAPFFIKAIKKNHVVIVNLLVFLLYMFSLHMLYQEGLYMLFICLSFIPAGSQKKQKEIPNETVKRIVVEI